MKRPYLAVIALVIVCGAIPVGAQVVMNILQLQDIKSGSTSLGYFHTTPLPRTWNFAGPTGNTTIANRALNIGANYAIKNADMGFVVGPGGVDIGTLITRPTCTSSLRGLFFTQWTVNNGITDAAPTGNSDGGVKDLTYQCCKTAAATPAYAWVAVACQ